MDLGFEQLGVQRTVGYEELISDYVSIETLSEEVSSAYQHLMDVLDTMDHLCQIQQVVQKYGHTESVEELYGENHIEFSVKGLGESLKKGWDAAVKWFLDLMDKIRKFFKNLFQSADKADKAVQEEAKKAKDKKQPFTAEGKVVDGNPTTVAKSFTNSNLKEIEQNFDRNVGSKANIDMIRSMTNDQSREVNHSGAGLAAELSLVITGGRDGDMKPVDESFINEAETMSKTLHGMGKRSENLVNSLRTLPDKLMALAEKKGDESQLKVAQNTLRQAGAVVGMIEHFSNVSYRGIVIIKNKLAAFNAKNKPTKGLLPA